MLPDGRSIVQAIGVKRVKLRDLTVENNSFGLLSANVEKYEDADSSPRSPPLLTSSHTTSAMMREAQLMEKVVSQVAQFVKESSGDGSLTAFEHRVGATPTNPGDFSLWVAGALPARLHSDGIHKEICQLQMQILRSRNVEERLKLCCMLATRCIILKNKSYGSI